MRWILFRSAIAFAIIAMFVCLLGLAMPDRTVAADAASNSNEFSYALSQAATTSAGVYDENGRLVRVLWTREQKPAGKATASWDGQDQFGKSVPSGNYEFRVVANHATYTNVGAIGNSGRAPTPEAHTPAGMGSVAVDSAGGIYTANGWDEAGADFTKWDTAGNVIYDGRYQMRNGQPNGAPYSIAVDGSTIFCGMEGWASKPWNHKQQVHAIRSERRQAGKVHRRAG